MATPMTVQPAFFFFVLTVFHVSLLVDCRPRLWDSERQQHSSFDTRAHAATSNMGHFYLELSGSVKKGTDRDFLVKTDTSNLVSIFNLRRKWFLCMDLKGNPYTARLKDKVDCLFQRIWLEPMNHKMMFYSKTVGQLLKRSGCELLTVHQEPPEPLLGPLVKRQKRSEEVNPSDPLRSQSHLSYFARVHKDTTHGHPEQDQAGAVSKETISSCDDPLRVLQTSGPVSPVKANIVDWVEKD
ncbi:fibroblast growth factor 23-like [Channa argus]|uniref:fibroblast growth factor 23-like n=1 Tax=Channa argus TaxID=215402 RepID=UPI0029467055|nr:hypothetical protein Q8A73_004886 [Channa argus]